MQSKSTSTSQHKNLKDLLYFSILIHTESSSLSVPLKRDWDLRIPFSVRAIFAMLIVNLSFTLNSWFSCLYNLLLFTGCNNIGVYLPPIHSFWLSSCFSVMSIISSLVPVKIQSLSHLLTIFTVDWFGLPVLVVCCFFALGFSPNIWLSDKWPEKVVISSWSGILFFWSFDLSESRNRDVGRWNESDHNDYRVRIECDFHCFCVHKTDMWEDTSIGGSANVGYWLKDWSWAGMHRFTALFGFVFQQEFVDWVHI